MWFSSVKLLAVLVVAGAQEYRYPPGVPRPAQPQVPGNDIRFHDPNNFQQPPAGQQDRYAPGVPQPHAPPSPPQPSGHGSHHGKHAKHTFGGKGVDFEHEKEHMKAHTEEKFIDLDKMSDAQVMAQYFRNFDLDKNGKVDGLEVLKSLHKMEMDHQEGNDDEEAANIMELVEIVDEQMNNYDENKDGMITYAEFVKNHKKLQANDDGL